MEPLTLVLIDDSVDFCDVLEQSLRKRYPDHINVVGVAHNGTDAIKMIQEIKPDAALIDICLPGADGMTVVETVKENEETRRTACFVLSGALTDFCATAAWRAGADYICHKPVDIGVLVKYIISICAYNKRAPILPGPMVGDNGKRLYSNDIGRALAFARTPEEFSEAMLMRIGFSSASHGFYFLKTGIAFCIRDSECLEMLTKRLYPKIGYTYGSTGIRVERSMRHSITVTWENGNPAFYYALKGEEMPEKPVRPKIGAFLKAMVNEYHANYK